MVVLFDSIIKFLSAYQIQSAMNQFRLYLALPKISSGQDQKCVLLFPRESDPSDMLHLQRFAFQNVRDTIYERLEVVVQQILQQGDGPCVEGESIQQFTWLSCAIMKALCYSSVFSAQMSHNSDLI
mmetsp:Transcript_12700/g.21388  ORF Transcript_12700/g.21388 Transcript_12700/m.21388 type:complete len:126 (+) Transcript_12700:25-402(+)